MVGRETALNRAITLESNIFPINSTSTIKDNKNVFDWQKNFFQVSYWLWCWNSYCSCCFWLCFCKVKWVYTNPWLWVGSAWCWRNAFEHMTQRLKQEFPAFAGTDLQRISHPHCFIQTGQARVSFSHHCKAKDGAHLSLVNAHSIPNSVNCYFKPNVSVVHWEHSYDKMCK